MANVFRKLFGSQDSLPEKTAYMAEPSILYHTRTERECRSYLQEYFEAKVLVPMDFRNKERSFFENLIRESSAVVGVTIEDVYTYPVWQDLEYAQSIEKAFFTLQLVKGRRDLDLYLIEGFTDFEKLSWEETKSLYLEIQKKETSFGMFIPKRPQY